MMIHDYDDERTLEEEENLSGESCSGELDDLEKVSLWPEKGASVAQLDAPSDWRPGGRGFNHR